MGKRVLVVDDSASVRQVVGIALRGAGYEVVEAGDGQDALARLDGQKLSLIISDVNMPRMDGISFVREVRKLPAYRFTPIVILTTVSEQAKRDEGRAAGAKAWMVKPFQPAQIVDVAARLVLP